MNDSRSCRAESPSAPPSGLGEGGQVEEEMMEAARSAYNGLLNSRPRDWSREPLRVALEAALPVSPLSRRVEELEAALEPFAGCQITEDGEPPPVDYDWPPMGERIKDWFGYEDFERARALLKDGER